MKIIIAFLSVMVICFSAHANDCRTSIIEANAIRGQELGVNDFSTGQTLEQILSERGITIQAYRAMDLDKQSELFLLASPIQSVAANSLTDLQVYSRSLSLNDLTDKQDIIKKTMIELVSCMFK